MAPSRFKATAAFCRDNGVLRVDPDFDASHREGLLLEWLEWRRHARCGAGVARRLQWSARGGAVDDDEEVVGFEVHDDPGGAS